MYHVGVLLLHGLNGFLVFLFLQKISKSKWASLLASLIFMTSTFSFETKVWISSIMHVLVSTFVLLSLLFYQKYFAEDKVVTKNIFLFLSLLSALFAFLTKENGIVAFALVPLTYVFLSKINHKNFFNKKYIRDLFYFFIVAVFLFIYSYLVQKNSIWIDQGVYKIDIRAFYILVMSMFALIYEPSVRLVLDNIYFFYIFLLILFSTTVYFYKTKKSWDIYWYAISFIIITFLPLVFFYFGSWHAIVQGRYSYLPAVGWSLFLTIIFTKLEKKKVGKFLVVFFVAIYLIFNFYQSKILFREYNYLQKQMYGMINSFTELKPQIEKSNKVIIVQAYPFFSNQYYIYMYAQYVSSDHILQLDKWDSEIKWDKAFDKYYKEGNLLLIWDNTNMKFVVVDNSEESLKYKGD